MLTKSMEANNVEYVSRNYKDLDVSWFNIYIKNDFSTVFSFYEYTASLVGPDNAT